MRLSKPVALLVLLASLLPIAHIVFFFVTVVSTVLGVVQGEKGAAWFKVLVVLHVLCIVWIWALLAFYLVFLFKSEAVPKDQKVLWAVVLFFANVLVMPVFWYLFIWRTPSKTFAVPSATEPAVAPNPPV